MQPQEINSRLHIIGKRRMMTITCIDRASSYSTTSHGWNLSTQKIS